MAKKGGKGSRQRTKERRAQARKARHHGNYLRLGPKVGHTGRKSKRSKKRTLKGIRRPRGPQDPTPGGPNARRRTRGKFGYSQKGLAPNFPLRPLRKRRHIQTT